MRKPSIFLLIATCVAVAAAQGQGVGSGEVPFTSSIYKSSHNSYDRNESLAQQIDAYNVWQLELDIYDYNGDLKVNHGCDLPSLSSASTLDFLLSKMIQESRTQSQRFTMIYVDTKGNGLDGCVYKWGSQFKERLKNSFVNALGTSHIYPASDFINNDKSSWPSYQELIRRGFNWAVIIDWHGDTPNGGVSDDLLFSATSTDPPPGDVPDNTVLINVDGGCDGAPTIQRRALQDHRWLYRMWPSCASDCSQMEGNYWINGLYKQYTFIATNCVNEDSTFPAPTHSPDPLVVSPNAVVECPNGYTTCDWGTSVFPFHDLSAAIRRASPMVTVLIQAGEYQATSSGVPLVVNQPMILRTAGNGPTTIR